MSAMSELDRQRRQIREMRVNQANARELQFSQVEFLDEKQDTEVRQLCLAQSVNLGFLPLDQLVMNSYPTSEEICNSRLTTRSFWIRV